MATTEEEKKLTSTTETTSTASTKPQIYGGSYDSQINDLYSQITGRKPFSYDVDGDALYQQYKDRYTQNAQKSMKDTMGQAAGLTGGYGSTYSQNAGQQAYDTTMQGLTDMIPTLEQNAYSRWADEGTQLQNQYSMLTDMAGQEANTRQNNMSNLLTAITTTGYQPTDEEIAAAGLTADQVNAYRQYWIVSNPLLAYNNGAIDADQYFKITGSYPHGYNAGGGDYYGGTTTTEPYKVTAEDVAEARSQGFTEKEIYQWAAGASNAETALAVIGQQQNSAHANASTNGPTYAAPLVTKRRT